MLRATLSMARASGLPQAVGLVSSDISAIAAIVNEAQERLIMDPLAPDEGWWGNTVRMVFTVQRTTSYAYIVTPRDVARLAGINICEYPIRIRNGFYEFLEFGPGLKPTGVLCGTTTCASGEMQAFERDNVVTLTDQTVKPATIRLYPADPADAGRQVILQGSDQNGVTVLRTDQRTQMAALGELITLESPFVDAAYQYQDITGIQKNATQGVVRIYTVAADGTEALLTSMESNETTASYRRYLLNNLPTQCCTTDTGTVQVTAVARLDFIPALVDSDYLCIQSIPALIEECQAIKFSRMDSKEAAQLSATHHQKAISILNGQLDLYLGKTNLAVRVPIFGSDRLARQPV